jgi:hypothetical protein
MERSGLKERKGRRHDQMIFKYILLWFPMVLIAIFNALLRESVYGSFMSALRAHQVSSLTAIIFFGIYVWLISGRWRIESGQQALVIGLIWVVMTVAFEFLFGHYVMGHPWSRLFADYNLLAGRTWSLVLLGTLILPYIAYWLRLAGE